MIRYFLLTLTILYCIPSIQAQTGDPLIDERPAESYHLILTVRDYETNEILNDVSLNVFNTSTKATQEIFTASGQVEFDVFPGADYELKGVKEGYLAKKGEVRDCSPDEKINSKSGYLVCTYGIRMSSPPVGKIIVGDLLMEKIEVNKVFTFENIYYDLDKSYIRPDAAIELDKIVTILKDNPTILTELGSHCDSRGSDNYNMALSQRRAEAAVQYIVSKGIDPSRITAQGYGESQLVNRCANGVRCSAKEHQKNRRTEFKITGVRK